MFDASRQTYKYIQTYIIPGAIILAGGLIAFAVFLNGNKVLNTPVQPRVTDTKITGSFIPPTDTSLSYIRPITAEDHIKGNPNAPVIIVEYSDYECQFCKRFHPTMNAIMDKYGASGEVAWVYRQFPITQIHPKNAWVLSQVAECINEQAGNTAFWQFTDGFFEVTPSNDLTDLDAVLPPLYEEIGVDQKEIEKCVASGKFDEHIQTEVDNAYATGALGTPWSIVVGKNGALYPISGAQTQATVERLIQMAAQDN